jgi:RNA polymerase sigma-70 factor (sigma-E family)
VRGRDEQDFADFVGAVGRSLRRTAFLLTGDWHRAEDAVQAGLVKVYVAWPRITQSAAATSYARKAVVSAAIDESRRPWRRERSVAAITDDRHDGVDRHGQVDDRLLVVAALAELPPRQRATLVLRYYDDLSVEEVADVLGCSAGTVKSQTARGLDALRARLLAAGIAEPITIGKDVA